jgi:hypothetical protein
MEVRVEREREREREREKAEGQVVAGTIVILGREHLLL